jgi:hypothetical protein
MLVGSLGPATAREEAFAPLRESLRAHPLHAMLMEDPSSARAFSKPRGYAGDAELIDFYYDRTVPRGTSELGASLFGITTAFPTGRALDFRRGYAAERLEDAWAEGKRVCALACGHWREADGLIGRDVGNLVGVDQDPLSLEKVWARHGGKLELIEANVLHYLRNAARDGERFDFIYTLGLTDYFDERAMDILHRLMRKCLAPGGEIMVANFLPDHLSIGWMDAVMDWHLIYRNEATMLRHAAAIGLATTFRDPTETVVFCEMRDGDR